MTSLVRSLPHSARCRSGGGANGPHPIKGGQFGDSAKGTRGTMRCRSGGGAKATLRVALVFGLALVLGTTACATHVTRITNGSARQERAIAPEAYAAFARARLAELAGDREAARSGYAEVLRNDAKADEAWIRLFALDCKANPTAAEHAYERARALSPQSAALYRARAQCLLERQNPTSALAAAHLALEYAPQDPESSQLVVLALIACGKQREALNYAWSHVAMFPNDTSGWFLLSQLAATQPGLSAQIQHRATARIPRQYLYGMASPATSAHGTAQSLDRRASARLDLEHGLATNDGRLVQRAARDLRLNTKAVIREAEALGAIEYAYAEATRAGAIASNDAMLWQIRLHLLDLLQDEAQFDELLRQVPEDVGTVTPANWELLRAVVRGRTGIEPPAEPSRDAK